MVSIDRRTVVGVVNAVGVAGSPAVKSNTFAICGDISHNCLTISLKANRNHSAEDERRLKHPC